MKLCNWCNAKATHYIKSQGPHYGLGCRTHVRKWALGSRIRKLVS